MSINSADKKPEKYVGPDGKTKIRMVPVDREVVKNEGGMKRIATTQSNKAERIGASGSKGLDTFKKKSSEVSEISNKTLTRYAMSADNDVQKRRSNRPAGKGDESDPKIGKRLDKINLAHKKGAFKVAESFDHTDHEDNAFAHGQAHQHHKEHGHHDLAAHHLKASDHHEKALKHYSDGNKQKGAEHARKAMSHASKAYEASLDKRGEHHQVSHDAFMSSMKTMSKTPVSKVRKEEVELDEAATPQMKKAAASIEAYAKKHGGIDKADFMKAAKMLSSGNAGTKFIKFVDDLDTDPREWLITNLAKTMGKQTIEKMFKVKIREGLNVGDGMGSWIKDFKTSDAPQFAGKSNKKKRAMAVAAYINAKRKTNEARGEDAKGHKRATEKGAGLTQKGVDAYNRKTGGNLKTAVTGTVKPGSKAAGRRKSFCARMGGMPGPMKDEKGRPTRKAMSLKRWKC